MNDHTELDIIVPSRLLALKIVQLNSTPEYKCKDKPNIYCVE